MAVNGNISLSSTNVSFEDNDSQSVTFSDNTGNVSVHSNDTSICSASVSGNTISLSKVNKGDTTVDVTVQGSDSYREFSKLIFVRSGGFVSNSGDSGSDGGDNSGGGGSGDSPTPVDPVDDYEIVYLYNSGDECTALSGGWTNINKIDGVVTDELDSCVSKNSSLSIRLTDYRRMNLINDHSSFSLMFKTNNTTSNSDFREFLKNNIYIEYSIRKTDEIINIYLCRLNNIENTPIGIGQFKLTSSSSGERGRTRSDGSYNVGYNGSPVQESQIVHNSNSLSDDNLQEKDYYLELGLVYNGESGTLDENGDCYLTINKIYIYKTVGGDN